MNNNCEDGAMLKHMTMMNVKTGFEYDKTKVTKLSKAEGGGRSHVVGTRLTTEQVRMLDKVVSDYSSRTRFNLSRSAVLGLLIETAAKALG